MEKKIKLSIEKIDNFREINEKKFIDYINNFLGEKKENILYNIPLEEIFLYIKKRSNFNCHFLLFKGDKIIGDNILFFNKDKEKFSLLEIIKINDFTKIKKVKIIYLIEEKK